MKENMLISVEIQMLLYYPNILQYLVLKIQMSV